MVNSEKSLATAEALTRSIEQGDVQLLASLYAPGSVVWHNTDQIEMPVEAVTGLVEAIRNVSDCSIEVRSRLATSQGFVQTQKNSYTFRDGSRAEFHAALVATLGDDGRITRLEEYLDSAGLEPLLNALA